MSRVGVLVMGPAGAGKSSFCNALVSHIQTIGRRAHIVNLDPAAEPGQYEFTVDIRNLISLDDVMEELELGPNGSLVYCFEYLLENLDWLDEEVGEYNDEFLIFDCPGQIELYTHIPILPAVIRHLQTQLNFSLCATYLLEAPFVVDPSKFFSGALSAMSAMILLELPHINVLSKMDQIKDDYSRKRLKRFLNPDPTVLAESANEDLNPKFSRLNSVIANLVDDYGMVQFLPLEANNPESVSTILSYIDDVTQWAESQEPKEPNDQIELDDE